MHGPRPACIAVSYTHLDVYKRQGNWKIKITFDGNADYKGCHREMDVTFLDRDAAPFHLKGGVTEVGIVYNADQSINYAATAQALREALIESTDPSYRCV